MKKNIQNIIIASALLLMPTILFGQTPPTLGTSSTFVLYSANGAVSKVGAGFSQVTGDVGSNIGGPSIGFGNINGVMHDADGVSASAAIDLNNAYISLGGETPATLHAIALGSETLTPAIYSVPAASTLGGILTLDGLGNPNACFVFQLTGAFAANPGASIVLINGAKACNVFWQVNGAVGLATNVSFKGTMICNGAITMATGDNLEGRALSIVGAVTIANGVTASTPIGCGSPFLTGPNEPNVGSLACYALLTSIGALTNTGTTTIIGDIGTNNGPVSGFTPLLVTGTIHSVPDASTAQGAADITVLYNYLNGLPCDIQLLYPVQFGNSQVLTPHVYCMSAAAMLTDTIFLDAQGNPNAVFVIQINGALTTSSFCNVVLRGGTKSSNVFWKIEGSVDISDHSTFRGTIVANNGAVTFLTPADTLDGRALSTSGAITTNNANVFNTGATSSITPSGPTNFCSGNSLTLTASSGTSYTWSTGANTQTISVNTSGTYSVAIAGVACGGSGSASISVTVTPAPTMTVNATSTSICPSGSATLTASGATTYSWSPATGLSATTGSMVIASPTITTTYTVTGTNGGCTGTQTVMISVNSSLLVNVTASSNTICSSGSTSLTASGAATYSWSPATGLSATTGSMVIASPTITTTYTVTGTNGGCTGTQTVMISVNSSLLVNVTASSNTICPSGSTSLTASGAATYSWSPTTGLSATTGSMVIASPTITTTYTVTGTNGGCTGTQTVMISVNSSLLVNVTASSNTICPSSSATLTASGAATYSWSPITGLSATTGSMVIASPTITTTYTVTGTNGGCSNTNTITVNVIPLPIAVITPSGATTFCQGGSVILTSTNGNSYLWSTGATTQSITVTTSGNYSVTVTNVNGCSATSTVTSVIVNQLPTAGFSWSVNGLVTYSFTNNSTNATTYLWNFGNGQTSTSVNPSNTYGPGTYTVTLVASNACGSSTSAQVIGVTFLFYNGFSPNGDGQNDSWEIPMLSYYTNNSVLIINRWGSEVWKGVNYDNNSIVWTGKNMKGEDLPDGTYFYIINYNNTNKRGWVIIKR
jgi:gliding motility-associated-like protein